MKKIIDFLDKHRFLLILVILLFVCLVFFSFKSFKFLSYNFVPLKCEKNIDENYCFNNKKIILKNASREKSKFFKNNKKRINKIVKKYELPKFSVYTAYYYEVAALVNYNYTGRDKDILKFFEAYSNTYDLYNFYKNNIVLYDIYYPYKIK